jgi:23S rRNA (uracil1939-C5)-methyltransferase
LSGTQTPDCPYLSRCSGCPALATTADYDAQLAQKQGRVAEARDRFPVLRQIPVAATVGAAALAGFRTRAKLTVAIADGRFTVGLFDRTSEARRVVDTPNCPVLPPLTNRVADAVRAFPAQAGLLGLDLRSLASATCADPVTDPDGLLVTLVIDPDVVGRDAVLPLAEALMAVPGVLGVAANLRATDHPQFLGGRTIPLLGVTNAEDRVGLAKQRVTFGAFAQAHRGQAARIQRALLDALYTDRAPKRAVHELFGGSGAIGLALAAAGSRVTLVEVFAPAAQEAQREADARKLPLRAIATSAEEYIESAEFGANDVVVMNPPRRGVPRTVRDALLVERPATLVYVSCDADTLARDVAPFVEAGYTISEFSPFDQIPLTDEVETIVVLERGAEAVEAATADSSSAIVTRLIGSHSRAATKLPRRFAPDGGTSGVALYGAPLTVEEVTALVLVRGVTHGKGKLVARVAVGGHTARNGGGKGREMREVHAQYVRLAVLPKAKESSKYLGKKGGHSLLLVTTAGWTPKQLFAQALAIGHPIIGRPVRLEGDPEATDRHFEERYTLDRPFVHIARVSYRDGDGASHTVNAPLAGDLTTVLLRLGATTDEIDAFVAARRDTATES